MMRISKRIYLEAENNAQFAVGLGTGLGSGLAYLPDKSVKEIFNHFQESMQFLRALGFAIGHVYSFLSQEQRNNIMTNTSPQFVYGLGDGLGHNFSSFKPEIQEQLLKKAEQSNEFGRGLGKGVAKAFKDLNDEILQREILFVATHTNQNSPFAHSPGIGLGKDFPSLSDETHHETLKLIEIESLFTKGLAIGLHSSFKYLSMDLQQQISKLGEHNVHFSSLSMG
ncbi:MAG: hypothetical protein WCC17_08280 [Candidatus Nitrosopolaris sp.]